MTARALAAIALIAGCSSGESKPVDDDSPRTATPAPPIDAPATARAKPDQAPNPSGVEDRDTGVWWAELASNRPLSVKLATVYCVDMGPEWRLPTRAELDSMFVGDEPSNRTIKPLLARGVPTEGKLWSGEDVSSARRGEKWVANLRNGHIYNGTGGTAHVRCVHGQPLAVDRDIVPSDARYASFLGPADASRTVTLFCQYGFHCGKARELVDELIAEGVRVEWKHWVIRDRLEHYSLAACAATAQGRFAAVHERLWAAADAKASAAEVRAIAEDLGLEIGRYDGDVANNCRVELEAVARQAKALELSGTPSLVVAGTSFNPASQPDEVRRAVAALPR